MCRPACDVHITLSCHTEHVIFSNPRTHVTCQAAMMRPRHDDEEDEGVEG